MTTHTPSTPHDPTSRRERRRALRAAKALPFVVAGAVAVSLALPTPAVATPRKPSVDPATSPLPQLGGERAARTTLPAPVFAATATASVPRSHTVADGETVSSIAARYGLSTASVLAANGISWSSTIFPGQVLTLGGATSSPASPSTSNSARYTIRQGDTVWSIAAAHGLSAATVLSVNGLSASSIIHPGQTLAMPTSSAPASTTSTSTGGGYTIGAGDTISSIAAQFGVTPQAILNANGLTWTSIIYAGRDITIPSKSASSGVTPLTAEMRDNAAIIIDVGRSLGVGDYGIVVALAAAMQESSLRNIDYGDRDSVGLFQQRPSQGWGTVDDIMDPWHAADLFYTGTSGNPGLLDIRGWKSMTVTQAAQAVQISAFPDAYAKWESSAWVWLDQLS